MFNQEQINELIKNKNVVRCSPKSITYSQKFQLTVIKRYYEDGLSPGQIFEEAGFSKKWLGKHWARNYLRLWRKKYKTNGKEVFLKENRGGPGRRKKRIVHKYEKEKIEYLETKIVYLEAENDFLAKLQGLKRK